MASESERVEAIRDAVKNVARDECAAYTEAIGGYMGDRLVWADDVTVSGPYAAILRAICEGRIEWEMVDLLRDTARSAGYWQRDEFDTIADLLSDLLTAAGITRDDTHDGGTE